jgi:DNA polymerase (family 10)
MPVVGQSNEDVADQFAEMAALAEVTGADRYRVRAYQRAADAIRGASVQLADVETDALTEQKGIGDSTAKRIAEYLSTGTIDKLEQLRAQIPAGVLELTRLPGLGPKTAKTIYDQLGIDSLEALSAAIEAHQLRDVPGLGAKSEEKLAEALARLDESADERLPAADALPLAERICAELAELEACEAVAYAGSLRRMRETTGDIDILVASTDPSPVAEAFCGQHRVTEVIATGEAKTSVTLSVPGGPPGSDLRLQADLRVIAPESWGAAMVYFTGSQAHNIRIRERAVRRDLTLSEYALAEQDEAGAAGAPVASRTETDVYAALGMDWIPPPMREDTGEVDAAASGELPSVVTVDEIQGDLHGHSDWSGDGKASLAQMLTAAQERGWAYWATTEHAANLTMNGLSAEAMRERRQAIDELRASFDLAILDGTELNIGADGELDYDDDFLAGFDFCVASVHTLMDRGRDEQTKRLVAAMEHPAVNVIGHPTGRMLGRRQPYDLDVDAVIEAAVRTGTALEVNASPRRLDLSGELVRRAVEAGATLAISCDAHAVGELDHMRHGVATAQRGWATADDVLNCRDLDGLRQFVAAKRR